MYSFLLPILMIRKAFTFHLSHGFAATVFLLVIIVSVIMGESYIKSLVRPGSKFMLSSSKAFIDLIRCVDEEDGAGCFHTYQASLTKEFSKLFSSEIERNLQSCLNTAVVSTNDIILLLNVQTCFFQAEVSTRKLDLADSRLYFLKVYLYIGLILVVGGIIKAIPQILFKTVLTSSLRVLGDSLERSAKVARDSTETYSQSSAQMEDEVGNSSDSKRSSIRPFNQTRQSDYYSLFSSESLSLKINPSSTESQSQTGITQGYIQFEPHNHTNSMIDNPSPKTPKRLEASIEGEVIDLYSAEGKKKWLDYVNGKTKSPMKSGHQAQDIKRDIENEPLCNCDKRDGYEEPNSGSSTDQNGEITKFRDICSSELASDKPFAKAVNSAPLIIHNEPNFKQQRVRIGQSGNILLVTGSLKAKDTNFSSVLALDLDYDQQLGKVSPEARKVITSSEELEQALEKVSFVDKNGKPFRRLFIPGLGWISPKKLHSGELHKMLNKENMPKDTLELKSAPTLTTA